MASRKRSRSSVGVRIEENKEGKMYEERHLQLFALEAGRGDVNEWKLNDRLRVLFEFYRFDRLGGGQEENHWSSERGVTRFEEKVWFCLESYGFPLENRA